MLEVFQYYTTLLKGILLTADAFTVWSSLFRGGWTSLKRFRLRKKFQRKCSFCSKFYAKRFSVQFKNQELNNEQKNNIFIFSYKIFKIFLTSKEFGWWLLLFELNKIIHLSCNSKRSRKNFSQNFTENGNSFSKFIPRTSSKAFLNLQRILFPLVFFIKFRDSISLKFAYKFNWIIFDTLMKHLSFVEQFKINYVWLIS